MRSPCDSRREDKLTAGMRAILAPRDDLKRKIQSVLTEELRSEDHLGHGRYSGFAYAAAEAYFHLRGGYSAGLQPMQFKHRGISHWWIRDRNGHVIDLALSTSESSNFPYERGRPRAFRYTRVGMSDRAATIVKRVRALRP